MVGNLEIPTQTDNVAIRELRDTVKDLNASINEAITSNDRFSIAFAGLAIVQIVLAIGVYASDILKYFLTPAQQVIFFLVIIFSAVYVFYKFLSDPKKSEVSGARFTKIYYFFRNKFKTFFEPRTLEKKLIYGICFISIATIVLGFCYQRRTDDKANNQYLYSTAIVSENAYNSQVEVAQILKPFIDNGVLAPKDSSIPQYAYKSYLTLVGKTFPTEQAFNDDVSRIKTFGDFLNAPKQQELDGAERAKQQYVQNMSFDTTIANWLFMITIFLQTINAFIAFWLGKLTFNRYSEKKDQSK